MKKLTALVVISMFALAACQPLNLSASGEVVDVAADSLNAATMETEDSTSEEPGDGESDSSVSESSSSDSMEMESSSESSDSPYSVDIWLE
ncbi:MAG: hypothetical protein H0S79_23750, partial [Anaerolineaceae bacterium]|nr:hypothetical protein [Anaerolineaceae bacterium]